MKLRGREFDYPPAVLLSSVTAYRSIGDYPNSVRALSGLAEWDLLEGSAARCKFHTV